MDAQRCRQVAVGGIDRILSFRLFGPTAEERAVLLAARQVIIDDDQLAARIAAKVGPYHSPEQGEMTVPKMTAQELKALDWQDLISKFVVVVDKLPAAAQLVKDTIVKIIDLFNAMQAKQAKGECCNEIREKCDAECEALGALVLAHLDLHALIADCCEPKA